MSNNHIIIDFGSHKGQPLTKVPGSWIKWVLGTWEKEPDGFGPLIEFCEDYYHEMHQELVDRTRVSVDTSRSLAGSQEHAVKFVTDALFVNGEKMVRLTGAAGTGKTFTARHILAHASELGYTSAGMAPSRVAADNLAEALGREGDEMIGTVASIAKLAKVYDGPNVDFSWSAKSPEAIRMMLGEDCILVVDEFSMVGDDVAGRILEIAAESKGKLLLIGDEAQLQPIGQGTPSLFCEVEPSVNLTEPQRFAAGSDLHNLSISAREDPRKIEWPQWDQSDDIFVYGRKESNAYLNEMAEMHKDFPDETTISLHSKVHQAMITNKLVRERLYGMNPPIIADGEQLRIVNTNDPKDYYAVFNEVGQHVDNEAKPKQRVYSGKMLKVQDIDSACVMTLSDALTLPVIRARVTLAGKDLGWMALLFAMSDTKPDPEVMQSVAFSRVLNKLAAEAKRADAKARDAYGKLDSGVRFVNWLAYHKFKESFIWVQYPYACTVHRVQGLTANNVFVHTDEIGAGRSRGRGASKDMAYVALTRGSTSMSVCR